MSNHIENGSKRGLHKKQAAVLTAAFAIIISALTSASYYANKRESAAIAASKQKELASLVVSTGDGHSPVDSVDGKSLSDYANAVQTLSTSKGVVVLATSDPEANAEAAAGSKSTVVYGPLTMADYGTKKKAEKAIASVSNDTVSAALGSTEFYIQDDGTETAAPNTDDAMSKGNANSPLIALIDTGDNNADSAVNLTSDSNDDVNGHGTRMDAAIRKAADGNVRILSIKAMNDDGTGTLTNIAAGIRYAINSGADIINMSIAAKMDDNSFNVLNDLVNEALQKNIHVVAAAGNYGDNARNYLPAGISGVISVSAADSKGTLQKNANYNAGVYIKGAASTSDAAAAFSGYLANSGNVKLTDHDDVAASAAHGNGPFTISKLLPSHIFRTQASDKDTFWQTMIWDDDDVKNTKLGYANNEQADLPANQRARAFEWGFNTPLRPDENANDFYGWGGVYANKRGYTFKGFTSPEIDGDIVYDADHYEGNHKYHIYAHTGRAYNGNRWTIRGVVHLNPIWDPDSYPIYYYNNYSGTGSGGYSYEYVDYGDSTSLNNGPSRAGYKFTGWNTSPYGNGTPYSAYERVYGKDLYYSGHLYLYAQWERIPSVTTSVNLNYGSNQNATMSKGLNTFNHDEKMISFDVWKSNNSGATWSRIADDTSSYDQYLTVGDQLIFSDIKITPGYKWRNGVPGTLNSSTTFSTTYVSDSSTVFPPTGTASDSGGWLQGTVTEKNWYSLVFDLQPISYTVKFDKNSAKGQNGVPDYPEIELASGTMSDEAMQYGIKKSLTKNAYTWRGHTFTGWNTQPDGSGTSYSDAQSGCINMTTVDSSTVTLYAQWKAGTASVYIDPNGGTYTVDGKSYTKKGEYSTTGTWGTSLELGDVKSSSSEGTIKYNLNAKDAVWAGNQYSKVSESAIKDYSDTTSFKLGGWKVYLDSDETIEQAAGTGRSGFVVDSTVNPGLSTYIFGDTNGYLKAQYYGTAVYLPLPQREGYTFVGWYYDEHCLNKAGNAAVDDSSQPLRLDSETPNVTLYARWKENEPYTFKSDMEYEMFDDNNPDFAPFIKIRKIDSAGNVLTKTADDEEFEFGICEGKIWNDSSRVLTFKTASGVYDKNNNLVIAPDSDKHDSVYGWWDITDLDAIKIGHDYTIHEISAPAGYSLCADQTFNVITNTAGYKADVAARDKALDTLNNASSSQRAAAKAAYTKAAEKVAKDETMAYSISCKDTYIPHPGTTPAKTTEDGVSLKNVSFTLYDKTDPGNTPYEFKTDDRGRFPDDFYSHLYAGHTMELKETSFEGYAPIDITFPVSRSGDTSSLTADALIDKAHTLTLRVKKTDGSGKALAGAEFKLYGKDENGNYVECRKNSKGEFLLPDSDEYASGTPYTAVSNSSGVADFGKVRTRGFSLGPDSSADITSLYVVETKAPSGYDLLSDPVQIKLPDKDGAVILATISDNKSAALTTLATGGRGTSAFIAVGAALIAAAAVYLIIRNHAKDHTASAE